MLSKLNLANDICPNDGYYAFSVKPIHLFHNRNLKTSEECTVVFLALDERHMVPQENKSKGKKRKQTKRRFCTLVKFFWLLTNGTFQNQGSTLLFRPVRVLAS